MGYAGWRSSEPLLPEEEEAGVQVALTRVSPVFLGTRWGWLWRAFLAGIWEVAGDKKQGLGTVGPNPSPRCGWLLLPVSEARITFIHSFIHSPILREIHNTELLRQIICSPVVVVLKV